MHHGNGRHFQCEQSTRGAVLSERCDCACAAVVRFISSKEKLPLHSQWFPFERQELAEVHEVAKSLKCMTSVLARA